MVFHFPATILRKFYRILARFWFITACSSSWACRPSQFLSPTSVYPESISSLTDQERCYLLPFLLFIIHQCAHQRSLTAVVQDIGGDQIILNQVTSQVFITVDGCNVEATVSCFLFSVLNYLVQQCWGISDNGVCGVLTYLVDILRRKLLDGLVAGRYGCQ